MVRPVGLRQLSSYVSGYLLNMATHVAGQFPSKCGAHRIPTYCQTNAANLTAFLIGMTWSIGKFLTSSVPPIGDTKFEA